MAIKTKGEPLFYRVRLVVLDARLQQVGSLEKNFECQMSKSKFMVRQAHHDFILSKLTMILS